MLKNNRVVSLLALTCVVVGLVACSSDKKAPLEGERISVLQFQDSMKVDEASQAVDIQLADVKENTAWPQPGGNATHTPGNLALGAKLKRAWSTSIGDGSEKDRKLITVPVSANGKVYASNTEGEVIAIDLQKGKELWTVNVMPKEDDSATVSPGLAYADHVLYVTDGIGHVLALNAEDGKKIWSQTLDQPVRGAPTVQDGRVYVITLGDETIALNSVDGAVLWRHEGVQESAGLLGAPSPAVEGSAVISTYSSGDVVALRAETGQEAWSDNLTGVIEFQSRAVTQLAGFRGHPVMDPEMVIIGNSSSRTIAIQPTTGDRAWQNEFGLMSTPWVSGNVIFGITSQNELVAMLKDTGKIRWSLNLPRFEDVADKEGIIFWNGPVLGGQTLWIAGSNEELWGIDALTGKVVHKVDLPDRAMLAPIIVQNTLVILLDDGTLVAYK